MYQRLPRTKMERVETRARHTPSGGGVAALAMMGDATAAAAPAVTSVCAPGLLTAGTGAEEGAAAVSSVVHSMPQSSSASASASCARAGEGGTGGEEAAATNEGSARGECLRGEKGLLMWCGRRSYDMSVWLV